MSSEDDTFAEALLRRYGMSRIGTAVNYVTGIVNVDRSAFSMTKLAGLEDKIVPNVNTTSKQTSQAHAYSTMDQEASSSSRSTKLAGVPFSRMALESHTSKSNSQLDTANGMCLTIEMTIAGSEMHLRTAEVTEQEFYDCAEGNFKAALDKLAAAKDPAAWGDAYNQLTRDYGHGFVSGLKLVTWAAGRLDSTYTSAGSEQQQRHGRGISFRTGHGGASSAKEWANDQAHSATDGTVNTRTLGLPAESPCQAWVSGWVGEYAGKKVADIQAAAPPIPAAPATEAKPPDITEKKPEPSPPALPKMVITDTTQLVKYMQLQQMASDGVKITEIAPDKHQEAWEAYQGKNKADADALNEDAIAQDGGAHQSESPDGELGIAGSGRVESNQPVTLGEGAGIGATGAVNLGSYAIHDLEFTPYKDVLPSLLAKEFVPAISRASLCFAKVHLFIMTRQLIASYLRFLSSLPAAVTGGHVTTQFADDFASALAAFIAEVSDEVSTDDGGYRNVVRRFDALLHDRSDSDRGWSVYRCFLANFSLLSRAPYGFLLTVKDESPAQTWYPSWGSWSNQISGIRDVRVQTSALWLSSESISVETGSLAKNSYRVYPIVVGGDHPGIALALFVPCDTYDPWSWCALEPAAKLAPAAYPQHTWNFTELTGTSGKASGKFNVSTVKEQRPLSLRKGSGYYQFNGSTADPLVSVTLTALDYKEVHGYTMHGIPMWYQPSFNLIKEGIKRGVA